MQSAPGDGYPVNVRFDRDQQLNQLWGIPLFGVLARAILAIPHFLVLWFYGMAVGITTLITWYPVLTRGEYPRWGYEIIGGYYRWTVRVSAYVGLLAEPYPPFSIKPGGYPVEVDFPETQTLNRAWGIPLLGIMARGLLAIPHLILLWLLGLLAGLLYLVVWFPVLVNGRFPDWGYDLIGGAFRWYVRVTAWVMLMVEPYPPFRLEE